MKPHQDRTESFVACWIERVNRDMRDFATKGGMDMRSADAIARELVISGLQQPHSFWERMKKLACLEGRDEAQ